MIAHYGADYAGFALRSVYDLVDEINVVYTPTASHGHPTTLPCPDSREDMRAACMIGPKVKWHDAPFRYEGPQRDYALSLCTGDLALVLDCDEIWHQEILEQALRMAWDGSCQTWRLNFRTPWRSFNWLCTDNMWPDRIHDKRGFGHEQYGYLPKDWSIYHMGYAVTDKIMSYKMSVHGHLSEWLPGWYEEKWNAWPPVDDCHPTCERTWYPKPFDRELLPRVLWSHPFWDKEVVR